MKNEQNKYIKIFFIFFALLSFLFSVLFTAFINNQAGISFLVTFCICSFLAFLPELSIYIKEFNIGKLKILLKEAEKVIEEGNVKIKQVQELALKLASPIITEITSRGNIWRVPEESDSIKELNDIVVALTELGIDKPKITKCINPFTQEKIIRIIDSIKNTINNQSFNVFWDELKEKIYSHEFDNNYSNEIKELEDFINKNSPMDNNIKEKLNKLKDIISRLKSDNTIELP